MDFDKIALTQKELQTLKSSAKRSVPIKDCERLLRYHLVDEERRHVPGYAGDPLGTCRATTLGRDYLIWVDHQSKTRRRETLRYWIPTAIALAALVKAFSPELRAAAAWLSMLLAPR